MVIRRKKKINRLLGKRTRGNGDTKNRRGAGSRGGRGLAGSHKHKFGKYAGKFGKEKRKVLSRKEVRALNIEQITQSMPMLLQEGKVVKEGDSFVIDGKAIGFDKLLSRGSIQEKWLVRNAKASKKAVEKVEKAGGIFEEPLGTEDEDVETEENWEKEEKEKDKEEEK